jgi:hypothetical protein
MLLPQAQRRIGQLSTAKIRVGLTLTPRVAAHGIVAAVIAAPA